MVSIRAAGPGKEFCIGLSVPEDKDENSGIFSIAIEPDGTFTQITPGLV